MRVTLLERPLGAMRMNDPSVPASIFTVSPGVYLNLRPGCDLAPDLAVVERDYELAPRLGLDRRRCGGKLGQLTCCLLLLESQPEPVLCGRRYALALPAQPRVLPPAAAVGTTVVAARRPRCGCRRSGSGDSRPGVASQLADSASKQASRRPSSASAEQASTRSATLSAATRGEPAAIRRTDTAAALSNHRFTSFVSATSACTGVSNLPIRLRSIVCVDCLEEP